MTITAKKFWFDVTTNGLISEDNSAVNIPELFPSIYLGEKGALLNIQFCKNTDSTDKYQDIPALSTAQAVVDLDYSNPIQYNLVKTDEDNWTVSGVSEEYYYNTDFSAEPHSVYINDVKATKGTLGVLSVGEYAYASNKVYVRITGDGDPDAEASGYVKYIPTYTKVYLQSLADRFNQDNTWDDAGSFRNPVLADGEVTFQLYANTDEYAERIGSDAEASGTTMQVQFFEAVTANLYKVYSFKFRCLNIFMPNTFGVTEATSSYYNITEITALLNGKQDRDLSAVEDNLAMFNATGDGVDSGFALATLTTMQSSLSSHTADTANPHATDIENLGSGTLAELNAAISDATLIDTSDSRLSDDRDPTNHASNHTDGTDDIQDATTGQKGLMTSSLWDKLDGIEALADVTDATNVAAANAIMDSDISAAEGFLRKTGVGAYEAIKSNLNAALAPTANEDSNDGYAVGSLWCDTTADTAYICLDATVAAAVWVETTAGAAGGEANTGSNQGTDGVGVFYQKNGIDLQFRHIAPGSTKITTTLNGQDVDIDINEANITSFSGDGTTGFVPDPTAEVGKFLRDDGAWANQLEAIVVAVSDEITPLTTGTTKLTFRMPFALTLTDVRASVNSAPTGSVLTVDINESGSTILSTKLTIDATEKTSTTAATPVVISDSALADDAEMTVDIDGIGSSSAGVGLKIAFIGTRT